MENAQIGLNEIKNIINSEAFKKIEKQIVQDAVSEATKTARRELELFKFEVIYPQIVPEKERQQTEREIEIIRDEKWKRALQQTNGNEDRALLIV